MITSCKLRRDSFCGTNGRELTHPVVVPTKFQKKTTEEYFTPQFDSKMAVVVLFDDAKVSKRVPTYLFTLCITDKIA